VVPADGAITVSVPALKSPERTTAKAAEDYADRTPGLPFAYVLDVLRAAIVVPSEQHVLEVGTCF
jgi:hypothetical protein